MEADPQVLLVLIAVRLSGKRPVPVAVEPAPAAQAPAVAPGVTPTVNPAVAPAVAVAPQTDPVILAVRAQLAAPGEVLYRPLSERAWARGCPHHGDATWREQALKLIAAIQSCSYWQMFHRLVQRQSPVKRGSRFSR